LLKGGEGLSTYAPVCELQIERRTIPGETVQQAVAEVQSIVDRLSAEDQSFCAIVECFFSREPFEVAREAAIVQHLVSAVHSEANKQPKYMGDTPWMDAALLSAAGVETVVYGPAGAGAHAIEEWVELESVYEVSSVLARTASDFCA
jgi:acetylornithine deacetylase